MHIHFSAGPKLLVSLCLALVLLPFDTILAAVEVKLVSNLGSAQGSAGGGSYAPQFSGDRLFFLSHARNLTTNDPAGRDLRLYSYHLITQEVGIVPIGSSGLLANQSIGNPLIAPGGQQIIFESIASNLAANDTNASKDLFAYDLATGQTELLTPSIIGPTTGNGDSFNPFISPNGRWLAFESQAKDLVTNLVGSGLNVYLHDLLNGTNALLSQESSLSPGNYYTPVVTPDGSYAAFISTASFLVPGAPGNSSGDVYVRNLHTGSLIWTGDALTSNNIATPYRCFHPCISDDGQKVAFKVTGYDAQTFVCLYELVNGKTTIISSNADPVSVPVLAGDGKVLVSENNSNVFLWNLETGTNLLISVDASGVAPGNGRSYAPVASAGFSRLAFLSDSSNLSASATNNRMQIFLRDLPAKTTRLVSVNTNGVASGDFTGVVPALASSGDLLAFDSKENNLVANDNNGASDVFLYSWAADSLHLVSRETATRTNLTGRGVSFAGPASLSANGRFVAFATFDTNVYPYPTTNAIHFVVWDTRQNRNVVMDVFTNPPSGGGTGFLATAVGSIPPILSEDGSTLAYVTEGAANSGIPGNYTLHAIKVETGQRLTIASNRDPVSSSSRTMNPSISKDGQRIAFQSDATSLASPIPDNNSQADVFLYNVDTQTIELISATHTGTNVGNNLSINPALSPNGRWVLFRSRATNLATNVPSGLSSAEMQYARDLQTGKTFSIWSQATYYDVPGYPVFTATNDLAFFSGQRCCPVVYRVVGVDLATTNVFYVCTNCSNPAVNADGRFVAYETTTNLAISDIYLRDFQTGQTNLITTGINGSGANGLTKHTQISPNGRFIVFSSTASNLVANDNNGLSDIFVHDRVLSTTTLLSVNQQGTGPAIGASFRPVLSNDGRTVVFQSFADNLVPGDYNTFRDIFVARLAGADSDNDGLDDDWEVAYFGDLSRSGSADFDNDGQTDHQEFIAGTDPRNDSSILRVMTISSMNSGLVTILWNSAPGKTYRIQYKDDLTSANWSELKGGVVATSNTASKEDTLVTGQRFYRVIVGGE